MKKLFLAVLLFLGVMFALFAWYDEQLFTDKSTTQKPFIMIMMATSGSMNNVVWYPKDGISGTVFNSGYVPGYTYTGTISYKTYNTFGYDALFNNELKVDNFGAAGLGGFYFGWRVLNTSTTKSVNEANKLGQVLSDDGSTIKVSLATYNWLTDLAGYWVVGKTSGVYARVTGKRITTVEPKTYYWFDITGKGGTFPDNNSVFKVDEPLFGVQPLAVNEELKRGYFYSYPTGTSEGGPVRYSENHLKWLLLYATNSETYPYGQLQETSYFHKYGTFDTSVVSPNRPVAEIYTNCNCSAVNSGGQKYLVPITRIQAGREAMCRITNVNWDKIVLGVFKFNSSSDGGAVVENLNNSSSPNAVLASIYTKTVALDNGGAPLAAALADLWFYWKPNGGQQGDYWPTGWKAGIYNGTNPAVSTAGWGPPGLKANECTHFYNIIVTDGQSTNDNFSNTKFAGDKSVFKSTKSKVRRSGELTTRWNYVNGWGDYDDHDPNNNSPTYCADATTCWLSGGTDYLDDVAYLLYHSDMCPNQRPTGYDGVGAADLYPAFPGDQNIVTHVVGFNMVNDMLKETATNGGGQFYISNNYEDLSNQLQAAINEIYLREEQMMYNVFASPKQAVTASSDLFGFKGTFVPQNGNTFWEGHLKCFQLNQNGEFPDDSAANTKWDAYDKLKNTLSSARTIYTFKYANGALIDASNAFNSTNIIPEDLGLASTDTTGRDGVVNFIRGENGFDYKLGDIFHFNPIVVGSPLIWKGQFDSSYQAFYTANLNRKEVVYIGTNDGMLHCIRVQKENADGEPDVALGGEELWGFIPPSQLSRVKNLYMISALNILQNVPPNCTVIPPALPACTFAFDRYFVDGKAMVKDIKIGTEWKTVLIFGMGIGGTNYCALDVTNPDEPKFLWEFTDPLMGYTEARPIISNVNDGSATYPAVFIPGGYDYWERLASAADTNSKLGKALFVLKAEPGTNFSAQAIKKFIWDGTTTGEASMENGVYVYTSTDFKYSFTAAPAVFDPNGDGIADYVYACDTGDYRSGQTGGRIWKIPVLGLPSNWIPEKIFQAPDSQTFFLSPTLGYDADWVLWVFIGAGRRSQITANTPYACTDPLTGNPMTCYTFTNQNGRFYAFMDKATNSHPLDGTSSTYFKNITTTLFGNASATNDEKKLETSQIGIYFDYFNLSPEVIFEPTPIFVDNTLTMNTYAPTVATGTTACGSSTGFSGRHYVYQFTLGKIGSSMAITATNFFGGKILGSGVVSSGKYIIYFGSEAVGTFTPTNYYWPSLEDTFGPVLWKEVKQ